MKYISKITTCFFLFLMMALIIKNTILCLFYEYEKELFIELFCENIAKPDLLCNGKCMLAKMQAEQNEQEAVNVLKQLQGEVVFNIPQLYFADTEKYFLCAENNTTPSYCTNLYAYLFLPNFTNPPEVV